MANKGLAISSSGMFSSSRLLAEAKTPEARAVRDDLARTPDELREKLPPASLLAAFEILAEIKVSPAAKAKCSVCSAEVDASTVIDHIAEHGRTKLMATARQFLQEWIRPLPEEIFVLLRETPVRGAVKVLDSIMHGVIEGTVDNTAKAALDAVRREMRLLDGGDSAGDNPPASGSSTATPAAHAARAIHFRHFQLTGKSFSVAASRLGRYTEKAYCDRWLHKSTVRTGAAVRDVEEVADELSLAHVHRGLHFEASLERTLASDGLDVAAWGLDVGQGASVLRFFYGDAFTSKVSERSSSTHASELI